MSCSWFFWYLFLFLSAVSAGIFERDCLELGISTPGFRSMEISSDGQYLAAGDCRGDLHIYNIYTSEYICLQVDEPTCNTKISSLLNTNNMMDNWTWSLIFLFYMLSKFTQMTYMATCNAKISSLLNANNMMDMELDFLILCAFQSLHKWPQVLGIILQDTHDAEILSLSFSMSSKHEFLSGKSLEGHYFLASGGRDRMIRLYDVKR